MNLKQALKRIEELERKVAALEARPLQQIHYHYEQPAFQPVPPLYPSQPWRWPYEVTCGGSSLQASAGLPQN